MNQIRTYLERARKENDVVTVKISKFGFEDLPKASLIFFFIIFISYFLHEYFNTDLGTFASVDIFTSGIFVTAMWLMANKKLENWICLLYTSPSPRDS